VHHPAPTEVQSCVEARSIQRDQQFNLLKDPESTVAGVAAGVFQTVIASLTMD
jgi:hypothetical protein